MYHRSEAESLALKEGIHSLLSMAIAYQEVSIELDSLLCVQAINHSQEFQSEVGHR